MPTWNAVNKQIDDLGGTPEACDKVRRDYLEKAEAKLGRTVIAYYSGFLQKASHPELAISDFDMNGMMAVVHGLDRTRGLDLFLHTPGGGIEAARAIVEYLYQMFGKDIRVIIPQMAMSAGTMVACAAREIMMGKHSCLGPTDPQVRGIPAMGVLAEIERAIEEMKAEPLKQIVWQQVFSKYPPAFIGDCERQIEGAKKMVAAWLEGNMYAGEESAADAAMRTVDGLMNYAEQTEHGLHYPADKARELGLVVTMLEADQEIQEAVLSVHHAFVATLGRTANIKIIENAMGGTWNVAGG